MPVDKMDYQKQQEGGGGGLQDDAFYDLLSSTAMANAYKHHQQQQSQEQQRHHPQFEQQAFDSRNEEPLLPSYDFQQSNPKPYGGSVVSNGEEKSPGMAPVVSSYSSGSPFQGSRHHLPNANKHQQLAEMESSLLALKKLVYCGWTYAVIWKIGPDHRTPVWHQSYLNESLAGAVVDPAQRFESICRQCQFTPARPGYAYVAWMRQSPLWWTRLMDPILTDKTKEFLAKDKVSVLTNTIDYIQQLNLQISILKKVEVEEKVPTMLRLEVEGEFATMDREEELSMFDEVNHPSSSPIGGMSVVVVEGIPKDDMWVIKVEANNQSRSLIQLLNVLLEFMLGVVTIDYGSLNGQFHANICVKN